jgi:hypothetical protein
MPEIRIGRIISRLSTAAIMLRLITSTTGEIEIADVIKREIRESASKIDIPPASERSDKISAICEELICCDACVIKLAISFN